MKQPRISPAVDRASRALNSAIDKGEFDPNSPLPGSRKLAKLFSVAPVTMGKAVARLRNEGILVGEKGERLRIAGAVLGESAKRATILEATLHKKIESRIRHDILNGMYRPGEPMPQLKVLQHRYGASYRTMRKALNLLVEKSELSPHKKTYCVPSLAAGMGSARLLLIYRMGPRGGLFMLEEYIHAFEAECRKAFLNLEMYYYDPQGDDLILRDPVHGHTCDLTSGQPIEGFLCIIHTWEEAWEHVIRMLARHRRPIALLDEAGGWRLPASLKTYRRAQIISSALNIDASREMARYLLRLGHKRIAYISPTHAGSWSHQRLNEICSVYANAGITDGVVRFTVDDIANANACYSAGNTRCSIDPLNRFLSNWKPKMPDEFQSEISAILDPGILRYAWGSAEIACRLAPLLEKALAEKSITAWACANDMAALMALSFLKSRTIAVPGRISVVGFDNSLESMKAGLTTYDFNRSAAFYAALRYVISSTLPGTASGRRPLNISGYLVPRATTRAMKT